MRKTANFLFNRNGQEPREPTMANINFEKEIDSESLQNAVISVFGNIGKEYHSIEYDLPYYMFGKYRCATLFHEEEHPYVQVDYENMYKVTVYDEDGNDYSLEGADLTKEVCIKLWEITEEEDKQIDTLAFEDFEKYGFY